MKKKKGISELELILVSSCSVVMALGMGVIITLCTSPTKNINYSLGFKNDVNVAKITKSYRKDIEEKIKELSEKYKVRAPDSIIKDRLFFIGAAYDFTTFPSGRIIIDPNDFLNTTPLDELTYGIIHEFGHHKYFHKSDQNKFTIFYAAAVNLNIVNTFQEGLFEEIPDNFGHPWDAPTELYASAFLLHECGLIDKYKKKYFPQFTEEQKYLAERIFEEVAK